MLSEKQSFERYLRRKENDKRLLTLVVTAVFFSYAAAGITKEVMEARCTGVQSENKELKKAVEVAHTRRYLDGIMLGTETAPAVSK